MANIYVSNELKEYLKKLNVNKLDDLIVKQIQTLFITAIADFKKGKLDVDTLSDIAGSLSHTILKEKGIMKTDLFHALERCAELEWEVRHISKKNPGNFIEFMNEVMDYYEKYKDSALT